MSRARSVSGVPTANQNEFRQTETAICLMSDESLRATREMLRLCHESQDAGAATLAMIHRQGEQLNRTEQALDAMHFGLKGAEANLVQLERCNCFCCFCFKKCCLCCSRRHKETQSVDWGARAGQNQPVTNQLTPVPLPERNGNLIPRITHDSKEDEMEANLQGVSHVVGNLKNLAIDLGTEVSRQNFGLDRMNMKAESNQSRLESAQDKTETLLNS